MKRRTADAGPLLIDDGVWNAVAPLIPSRARANPAGRKRIDDRMTLNGILFVLATGIAWERLPRDLGYGSGVTCWRRLREWQRMGVWEQVRAELLERLDASGQIDWFRALPRA
jgi:transposase